MPDEGAVSPHLVRKQNLNYGVAVSVINDSIKSGEKKKLTLRDTKGSSRNQAMRTLLFYEPSPAVCENMISLISYSDKTTQRLAYYHFNRQQNNLQNHEAAQNVITSELNEKQPIGKRLLCLRSFSHLLTEHDKETATLLSYAEAILLSKQTASKKKDKAKEAVERNVGLYGSLLAIRQLRAYRSTFFTPILALLETAEFPVTLRHAVYLLGEYTKQNYAPQVGEHLRKFLPNTNAAGIRSKLGEDPFARVYFVQLASYFASGNVPNECKQFCDEYYKSLGHFIWDISPRVAFEAIHSVCQHPKGWKKIEETKISPREGVDYVYFVEEQSLLMRTLLRLNSEICENIVPKKKSQCLIHSALRALITVSRTYVDSDYAKRSDVESPLTPLLTSLRTLLQDCNDILRNLCLKTVVWLSHPSNAQMVLSILVKEVEENRLNSKMYSTILRAWNERVELTPNVSNMALEFVFIVATERPELLPGRELIHLWENIIL